MPAVRHRRACAAIRARAAEEAHDAAPHLRPFFDIMLPRLPLWLKASQNIRTMAPQRWLAPLPLDQAITCPWIAVNTDQRVNALCIDIDHADGPELVAKLPPGCPKPTLVIDPWSGRSHAILPLVTPVLTGDTARRPPIALARYAHRLLALALQGNALPFVNPVKCPAGLSRYIGGPRERKGIKPAAPLVWEAYVESGTDLIWLTQLGDGAAELRAVVEALVDDNKEALPPRTSRSNWRRGWGEPSTVGRNCNLFDQLRFWCYREGERDADRILAEAARLNDLLPNPLSASEVACIARSVADFMQNRYSPRRGGTRGRDRAINRGLDIKARQALAGARSAEQRRTANEQKVAAAVAKLREAGERVVQRQVAVLAKVSERTVQSMPEILGT